MVSSVDPGMSDTSRPLPPLRHGEIAVDGLPLHLVEGGPADAPAVVFLHGWPENWQLFESVMGGLAHEARVVAIDLPGVGCSLAPPPAANKRSLARMVLKLIARQGLRQVTLVGHDVGGMITYAALHEARGALARAVIMNVAVPGLPPWEDVVRHPQIWHFAFHAIPDLPEALVTGRQAPYFAFFYNRLSGPAGLDAGLRTAFTQAYGRPEALRAGFDWYRAFADDARDNAAARAHRVDTPVLYLRGDREGGDLARYLGGLREGGLHDVRGALVADSGHFSAAEQPRRVIELLRGFIGS